jgi:hypothetical protein
VLFCAVSQVFLADEKKKKKKTKKIEGRLKLGRILWGKSSVTGASLSVPPPPSPPPRVLFSHA